MLHTVVHQKQHCKLARVQTVDPQHETHPRVLIRAVNSVVKHLGTWEAAVATSTVVKLCSPALVDSAASSAAVLHEVSYVYDCCNN
jgi:hypothetical protein